MIETLTPEDHMDGQLIVTANTMAYAYLAFGETYATYQDHSVHLEPLESTPLVPVNHSVDIQVRVPLQQNREGQLIERGTRKLFFTLLGEERPKGSGPAMGDGQHNTMTRYTADPDKEIPVLAEAFVEYDLHRPKTVRSSIMLDGVTAGMKDVQPDEPFFLDFAANLLGSRSMSVRRLAAIATELAVSSGRSRVREHGRLDARSFVASMREYGVSPEAVRAALARDGRALPTFTYDSNARMIGEAGDPTTAQTKLSCTYIHDGTRFDATFFETEYTGWSPADPEMHAMYTQLLDEETGQIGVKSRAFDAELTVSNYPEPMDRFFAGDSRSLGRLLRHMRRGSEAYIDMGHDLLREAA